MSGKAVADAAAVDGGAKKDKQRAAQPLTQRCDFCRRDVWLCKVVQRACGASYVPLTCGSAMWCVQEGALLQSGLPEGRLERPPRGVRQGQGVSPLLAGPRPSTAASQAAL